MATRSGASIDKLYLRQDELQEFAVVGTAADAITDEACMLYYTTHDIESSEILNKAVRKWQATTTAYTRLSKAQFILDFNKYHTGYLSK